jgi:hypothetical protein
MFSTFFRKATNKMYYCNDNNINIQKYIRKIEGDLNKEDLNKKTLIIPSNVETNNILINSYNKLLLPFVSIVCFFAGYIFKNWVK